MSGNEEQSQNEEQPKIIVDSNWKEQVAAEKEALRQQAQETQETQENKNAPEPAWPPASFATLVSTLATQAVAALGQMVDPEQEEVVVNLDFAKHMIDTLALLEEKTKGNLTPEESTMLADVLHQLRMLFVAIDGQAKAAEQ